jgi:hypothetical protein
MAMGKDKTTYYVGYEVTCRRCGHFLAKRVQLTSGAHAYGFDHVPWQQAGWWDFGKDVTVWRGDRDEWDGTGDPRWGSLDLRHRCRIDNRPRPIRVSTLSVRAALEEIWEPYAHKNRRVEL